MSSIDVRKGPENRPLATRRDTRQEEWDPARLMRGLLGWDPFRDMTPWRGEAVFTPAFEVKETKDGYVFRADVPGIAQEDLEVHLTGHRLTISGKREAEKREEHDQYYAVERSYGSFTRAFQLPDGIDANRVVADLHDGVLTVTVAKVPSLQPKKIAVSTAQTPRS
jgi:HSP20 family protein